VHSKDSDGRIVLYNLLSVALKPLFSTRRVFPIDLFIFYQACVTVIEVER
jgi:hypothetical protein